MDPVISMTKQGVRNLNNLGPKKKKVVAAEAEKVQDGADQATPTEQPAEPPAVIAATE